MKIFLDMDGVICNFNKKFIESNSKHLTMRQYIDTYSLEKAWQLINSKGVKFWSEMEWMDDGKELWEFLKPYNPIIISSPSHIIDSQIGKTQWIVRELGMTDIRAITKISDYKDDTNVIFTHSKYLFAKKDSMLIDDYHRNTSAWPGNYILHKTTEQTKNSLRESGY